MHKLLVSVLMLVTVGFADIIWVPTWIPDLDHENAVLWNINIGAYLENATAKGEVLVSADLYVADLMNLWEDEIDSLFINLLDVSEGSGWQNVVEYEDPIADNVNYFSDWASAVPMESYSHQGFWANNYTASLDVATINSYSSDNGWVGIGLDPDCHYVFNRDLSMLVLETAPAPVPEPTIISLIGCGLLGFLFIRRKK
ncbi:MAG: PEP-CTERM sorting domain-containing protein [Chitinispirillaceae bacterium]|nr:PEP-CTERM sorting domain-containing protein [Chitinispirillaceae bacterium]